MTDPTARAAFRAAVSIAGRILPVHYPLEAFIAVNPLGGLEELPFARAIEAGEQWYGAAGTLPETAFRAAHAAGRITDDDLRTALTAAFPALLDSPGAVLATRHLSAVELLRTDLLHGPVPPPPARAARTRAEERAPAVADTVDTQTGKWCAAFTGGQASWPMPGRDRGFYPAWRDLAARDPSLPRRARAALRDLPATAEEAALAALHRLGVPDHEQADYLRAHLTRMPGWAAYARWCGERAGDRRTGLDLVGYLAMRLSYEAALLDGAHGGEPAPAVPAVGGASPRRRAAVVASALGLAATDDQLTAAAAVLRAVPPASRATVWLAAYEEHYRRDLLRTLSGDAPAPAEAAPDAQVVCCIDVRSEGLRRRIEERGRYETFGFAGFFAVAMRFRGIAGGEAETLCPALVEPVHVVAEVAADRAAVDRHVTGLRTLARGDDAWHAAKDHTVAPFVLAETAGWATGPLAAVRTAAPAAAAAVRRRLRRAVAPPAGTGLDVAGAISLPERILYAQAALTTMGLTRFAPLVVFCAHGSTTENNPYRAALDCGACGGHRGGPNARALAAILNDPDVRDGLTDVGITVPPGTWFAAAEHDTTTDRVKVLDPHLVPEALHPVLSALTADLAAAGARLAQERAAGLPGAPRRADAPRAWRHAARRAADWAQVYPEWSLAGNAAFVVGPRRLTAGHDLRRRAFLHSYDARVDPDGTALETILTAPMVVAQWINCQYYFSSVAPEVFGAGTKTVHNAVGGVGVLAGPAGDLRLGLPWQSVAAGAQLVHEPMRLLTVVEAPPARLDAVIARNPVLRRLFGNDWVALAARTGPGEPWLRWRPDGWQPWSLSATNLSAADLSAADLSAADLSAADLQEAS